MKPGSRVRITLPADVASWTGEEGRTWIGVVVAVNGDSIDVRDECSPNVVEPVDRGYVRGLRGGKQPGAGRPKLAAPHATRVDAHLTDAQVARLDSLRGDEARGPALVRLAGL